MFYLLTGGAGFIGSNIVEKLLECGHKVRVLDNFSTGKRENLREFEDEIEIIEGDVRDTETVRRSVKGVRFCLHQAALTSVARSVENPLETSEVNIEGTLKVLIAARELGNVKVVYASSASVYGNNPELPRRENLTPEPLSPYALSKLCGEYYCKIFNTIFNVPTVSLRYFNVFGKKQNPDSPYAAAVPKFIDALRKGKSPLIYGDGEQTRDFTYVDNVVSAVLLACDKDEASGEIFNIGCGKRTSINELFLLLTKIMKVDTKPKHVEERPGEVRHSEANIDKARRILGYKPEIGLEEGLRRILE